MSAQVQAGAAERVDYVTVVIGGQLFGLPIHRVQDVFMPDAVTRVPLASAEIAGVLNLRGRIVTAIDMRRRLGMPERDAKTGPLYAVGVEMKGEAYGLVIDSVGEVLNLATADLEANPVNLDKRWVGISAGVFRLDGHLLVVLDVDRVLSLTDEALAA
jgi:purine-binding chemotaxis protein CheW